MSKPFYSLAEAYQRGLIDANQPSPSKTTSYYVRIYPELDIEELLKVDALENLRSEDGSFSYRDPRVAAHTYGWTASVDYCNEDTDEIVHRAEFTRSTRDELYDAMREYADVIKDERQQRVYRKALNQFFKRKAPEND